MDTTQDLELALMTDPNSAFMKALKGARVDQGIDAPPDPEVEVPTIDGTIDPVEETEAPAETVIEPAPLDEARVIEREEGEVPVLEDISKKIAKVGPIEDRDIVNPEPEVGMRVPQGYVAQSNVSEEENIVENKGLEVPDFTPMADHPAFKSLMESAKLLQLSQDKTPHADTVSAAEDLSVPEAEQASPITQLRHTLSMDQAFQDLVDDGYSKEAIVQAMIGEPGLVPTTSPLELLVPGPGALAILGKSALLKTIIPLTVATLPIDVGLVAASDEIAETNWLAGLGFAMATTMGTTMGALKLGQIDQRLTSKLTSFVAEKFKPENKTWFKESWVKGPRTDPFSGQTTPGPRTAPDLKLSVLHEAVPSKSPISAVAAREVAQEVTPIRPAKVLTSKLTDLKAKQVEQKINSGDTSSLEVHQAVKKILKTAQSAPEKTSQASAQIEKALVDLDNPLPSVQAQTRQIDSSNPFLDYGGSSRATAVERYRPFIANRVRQEWFGNLAKGVNRDVIREALLKQGTPESEVEAVVTARLAQSMYGEHFMSDFTDEFNSAMAEVKNSGSDPADFRTEIRETVRDDLYNRYIEGMNDEVEFILANADYGNMALTKSQYIRGGLEDPDAKFITPMTDTGLQMVKGPRGYELDFKDWDLSKLTVRTEPAAQVVLPPKRLNPQELPPVNTAKIKLNPFKELTEAVSEERALIQAQSFVNFWNSNSSLTWKETTVKGVTKKRPSIPEVEARKTLQDRYKKKDGKVVKFQIKALSDDLLEDIAKMVGWNEDRVVGVSNERVIRESGRKQVFNAMGPEIVNNKALHDEQLKLYPNYFKTREAWESQDRGSKYYVLSGANQIYQKQREAYLRKVLGDPEYFYGALDRLAAMHLSLTAEINRVKGTPAEILLRTMYIRVGDVIAGTNTLQSIRNMQRANVRAFAWAENQAYAQLDRGDLSEDRIAGIMDNKGISYDEALEVYEQEVADMSEPKFEAVDAGETGQASDIAGTSVQIGDVPTEYDEVLASALREFKNDQYQLRESELAGRKLTPAERQTITAYASSIEDILGSRVIDAQYQVGTVGASPKINLFKVNNTSNVWELVERASYSPEALAGLNPRSIGLTAHDSLSPRTASSLAKVAKDLDVQVGSLAKELMQDTGNLVKAIAFEKARAVQGTVLSAITSGRMSSQAKKALAATDFYAYDDLDMIHRLSIIAEENYGIYGDGSADTRAVVMAADIYSSFDSLPKRIAWASDVVDAFEPSHMITENQRAVKTRVELTKLLQEACD